MDLTCPWCGYRADGEYAIHLHIEEHHTEDSPFAVRERAPPASGSSSRDVRPPPSAPSRSSEPWTRCTRHGCGEYVKFEDIDNHLEMHEAIAAVENDNTDSSDGSRSDSRKRLKKRRTGRQKSSPERDRGGPEVESAARPSKNDGLLRYFSGASTRAPSTPINFRNPLKRRRPDGRLGTAELGPHAFEKSMPSDVRRVLEQGGKPVYENKIDRAGKLAREATVPNETPGLVPIMADLSNLDRTTTMAYYCDRHVKHVHKLRCDGNFCGYWNIQVLVSYLHAIGPDPSHSRDGPLPSVLEIQDTIEDAWDAGTCTYGRTETGGIRSTRKWIGTHEAAAYFLHTGVPVTAMTFKASAGEPPAHVQLLDYIEAYFISGEEHARRIGESVYITKLPPIYFQRTGHSLTIVGLERTDDGDRELVMFDSSFATTEPMKKLVAGRDARARVSSLMRPYRKDEEWLGRWKEFEILIPMVHGNGQ